MKYTISEKADIMVDNDMKVIVEEIRKKIPEVLSIVLTGSFSRGEGPVKEIDGKYFPYNDYDISVITLKKFNKNKIDKISIELSKKLGYKGIGYFYKFKKEEQKMKENFYVDLKVDTVNDLRKLLPRIRNYELKNESMLLWGRDYRKIIPDFELIEVPLTDAAKLILDRLSQLVQYYSIDNKHDDEFLTYIIQQAYSACCTSLLMLNKNYNVGYGRAMKIFKECYKIDFNELYKKIPDLDEKIEKYVNWKKNPIKLPFENVEKEWFIAKKNLIEVAKYFFGRFLNKQIKDNDILSDSILNMKNEFYGPYLKLIIKSKTNINIDYRFLLPLVSIVLKYKYYRRLKNVGINDIKVLFGRFPDLVIFASLIYIASSIKDGMVNKRELDKGVKLLSKIYPVNGKDWEEISLDYGNAYIAFFMQKL